MVNDDDNAVPIIAFAILLILAIIASYVFTLFIFVEPNIEPIVQPSTGPTGPSGKQGVLSMTGPTGPRGPIGPGSFLRTRIFLTSETTYWNYWHDAHCFPFILENWYTTNYPISLLYETNEPTNLSYQNFEDAVDISSIKTLTPSTMSEAYYGSSRTSNYSGFDYIIIQTRPDVGGYPPDESQSELYLDEDYKFYLLVRINILEPTYFGDDLYNGVLLQENNEYRLKPGRFILSYYSTEE